MAISASTSKAPLVVAAGPLRSTRQLLPPRWTMTLASVLPYCPRKWRSVCTLPEAAEPMPGSGTRESRSACMMVCSSA
jgi:hypothetical protein